MLNSSVPHTFMICLTANCLRLLATACTTALSPSYGLSCPENTPQLQRECLAMSNEPDAQGSHRMSSKKLTPLKRLITATSLRFKNLQKA